MPASGSFSKIETRIAAAFFERFAKALAASVASVAATPFTLEAPPTPSISIPSAARNTPFSQSS